MKRFCLCLALVLGLAQFSNLLAQEALVELGSITNVPMQIASTPGVVQAMSVNIANSSYVPYYLIDYSSSQTWYMVITVLNTSAVTQSFKVDFDLRYADGASYYVYRAAYTIAAGTLGTTRVNVVGSPSRTSRRRCAI